jgi:glycosyltransferase involved in cell wall biosynthesis
VKKNNKSINFLRESLSEAVRIKPNLKPAPLVSVIIPVYDVELYIKECLDSVSNQTYRNLEIIVVDDGTPDNAGHIADECAQKDKRIKVIHQKNGGLSAARNSGYDIASGEYIVFVDSDDALAPDYVEYMLGVIETTNTDTAMSLNKYDIFNQAQIGMDKIEVINADEVLENIEYNIWGQEVWNKIYKKSYLDKHGIRHIPEILFGEGNTFNHYVLQNVGSVGVGRRRVYYYRYNPDSSTRKFIWNKRMQSFAYALEHRQKVIDTKGKRLKRAFQYHMWHAAFYIVREMLMIDGKTKYRDDFMKYYKMLRALITGPLFADPAKVSMKHRILPLAVFFLPKTMCRVWTYRLKRKSGAAAFGAAAGEFDRKITQMLR